MPGEAGPSPASTAVHPGGRRLCGHRSRPSVPAVGPGLRHRRVRAGGLLQYDQRQRQLPARRHAETRHQPGRRRPTECLSGRAQLVSQRQHALYPRLSARHDRQGVLDRGRGVSSAHRSERRSAAISMRWCCARNSRSRDRSLPLPANGVRGRRCAKPPSCSLARRRHCTLGR